MNGLQEQADAYNIPLSTNHVGGMFGLFFTEEDSITSFEQVMNCNTERFNQFFHAMLKQGVYLAPSSYEAGFISITHTNDDIDETIEAAKKVFSTLN